MSTLIRSFVISGFAAFLAVACGSKQSETVGDQCSRVMNAYCERVIACGATGTLGDCESVGKTSCCQDKCGDDAISDDSSIDTCVTAMKGIPCATVTQASAIPTPCVGVVKHSSVTPRFEDGSFAARLSSAAH